MADLPLSEAFSAAFEHLSEKQLKGVGSTILPPPPVFTDAELSNFGDWVKFSGMRPEGARDFNLDKYPYQKELYDEQRDNLRQRVVIMKAAQTGLTVKLLNRSMWLAADARKQVNIGLGFPTQRAVEQLSATRFRPQLMTSSKMIQLLRGVVQVGVTQIGVSNMRFLGLRSGVSNDSNPLDAVFIDEVRLIPSTTVERFFIRISESTIRSAVDGTRGLLELNSTAGFPNQDIHKYFLESTQGWWAVRCPNLKCFKHIAGIILPREFAENPGRIVGRRDNGRYYYKCPRCQTHLDDEAMRSGFYIHENPGAQFTGYQFSQLIKGDDYLNTAIMPAWNRAINLPEFFNSMLGLPYMDKEAVPATLDAVERCMDELGQVRWPLEPLGRTGEWRSLGVDQRAPEKHCVVKTLLPTGEHRLDHVEVLEVSGEDAAPAIVRLARAWGVSVVVIDGEPSYDLAVAVARALPRGIVWLQDYVDGQAQMIKWEDKRSEKSIRRSSGETKYEYRCLIDRYKGIDWSLGLITRRKALLPAKSVFYDLKQSRQIGGVAQWSSVSKEYVKHLGNFARYKAPKMVNLGGGEQIHIPGEYVLRWRYLHVDPHFAHANLYADAGLAYRSMNTSIDTGEVAAPAEITLETQLPPDARPSVLNQQASAVLATTCQDCRFWKAGYCRHEHNTGRNVATPAAAPACDEFSRLK